jgi:hypothetical protein
MSTTEERVSQAVREIFEFGAAQPSQFVLAHRHSPTPIEALGS